MALRGWLLARGAFNLLFGLGLLIWLELDTLQGLSRGGFYALADGLLGLALAAALRTWRGGWLFLLTLIDGLVRVVIGVLILSNPGMEKMVFGTVFFFAALVVVCVALGIVGMLYALIERPAIAGASGQRGALWPVLTLSLSTLLLGAGLAVGFHDQERRVLLACYAIAVGLILGLAGHRLGRAQ